MHAPRVFASAISKSAFLFSDCHGSVTVVAALLFPVLIGGMGLGAEVGYWYVTQRKLQHAADASAYAAVVRLKSGDGQTKLEAAGLFIAQQSGFRSSIGTMALHHPPTSGPNAGDSTMVEVVLTEALPRYFTGLFKDGSVQIRARSVAKNNELNVCVLALSPNANNAVQVAGSSNPAFVNCTGGVEFDIQFLHQIARKRVVPERRLRICKRRLSGTGECHHDGLRGRRDKLPCDPGSLRKRILAHCHDGLPARQCRQQQRQYGGHSRPDTAERVEIQAILLAVAAGACDVWAGPLYCRWGHDQHRTDDLRERCDLCRRRKLSLSGSLTVTLSPPNTGPYSGLLFFGDRDAAAEGHTLTGDLASVYQGAIYFPTGNLTFTGSSNVSNGCTQVIAKTITFTGSSTVRAECANVGVTTLTVGAAKIALSE